MQNKILTIIYLVCSLTFFSLLYPEFVFVSDSYEYVEVTDEEEKEEWDKKVCVKSRIWMFLSDALKSEGNETCQKKQEKMQPSEYLIRVWED